MEKAEIWQIVSATTEQFAAERELVASRLNWNLTFQGFMIASYALVATADTSEPGRHIIQTSITGAGLLVAASTLAGIHAASKQSDYLKEHWRKFVGEDSAFPRPYSVTRGSKLGRMPPRAICVALMFMWCVLQVASIWYPTQTASVADCRKLAGNIYECPAPTVNQLPAAAPMGSGS